MRISEFSSLVFNDESYKFDQNYGIMQVFGQDDPVMVCVAIDPLAGDQWDDDVRVSFIVKNLATGSYSEYVYGDTGTITFLSATSYCVADVMTMLKDSWTDDDGNVLPGKYSFTVRRKVSGEEEYKELSAEFMVCEEDSECLKDTLLLTYSNKRNVFDTIFRKATAKTTNFNEASWVYKEYDNIFYGFRFKGSIVHRDTEFGLDSEIFEDQFSYSRLLSGFKKDKFSLVAGDNWGVTNGMGRLFRNALSCSETFLDGERISLAEGEIEREEIGDTYPMFRFVAKISKEHDMFGNAETIWSATLLGLNNDEDVLALNEENTALSLNNA